MKWDIHQFIQTLTEEDLYRIRNTAFTYVCFYRQGTTTKLMFTFNNSEFNYRLKNVLKNNNGIYIPVNHPLIMEKLTV